MNPNSQLELIERQPHLTRAVARERAMRDAKLRAERGMAQAASSADYELAGWCAMAVEQVRRFAAGNPGVFSIEQLRTVLEPELPEILEKRAWGYVVVMAAKRGYIERVPKVFLPAASSNGAPKPAWRRKA